MCRSQGTNFYVIVSRESAYGATLIRRVIQHPVETEPSRSERWCWLGAIWVWLVGDLVTTVLAINVGLTEGNLALVMLAHNLGIDAIVVLIASKLGALTLGGLLFSVLALRVRVFIPVAFVVVGAVVVGRNLWIIFTVGV